MLLLGNWQKQTQNSCGGKLPFPRPQVFPRESETKMNLQFTITTHTKKQNNVHQRGLNNIE